MRTCTGVLTAMLVVAGISGLAGATTRPTHATPPALTSPAGAQATTQAPLLQFRSGGHILGFAEDRMYTVGMGGALIEEFVGAHKVRPQAAEPTSPATTPPPSKPCCSHSLPRS